MAFLSTHFCVQPQSPCYLSSSISGYISFKTISLNASKTTGSSLASSSRFSFFCFMVWFYKTFLAFFNFSIKCAAANLSAPMTKNVAGMTKMPLRVTSKLVMSLLL